MKFKGNTLWSGFYIGNIVQRAYRHYNYITFVVLSYGSHIRSFCTTSRAVGYPKNGVFGRWKRKEKKEEKNEKKKDKRSTRRMSFFRVWVGGRVRERLFLPHDRALSISSFSRHHPSPWIRPGRVKFMYARVRHRPPNEFARV